MRIVAFERSSSEPSILMSRSSVKRLRSALRTRQKSAAANPVTAAAFPDRQLLPIQHCDKTGSNNRLRLFEISIRISEVAEHISASRNQFQFSQDSEPPINPGRLSSFEGAHWRAQIIVMQSALAGVPPCGKAE